LTENHPSTSRRARLAAGFGVVAVSLVVAAGIAGVGFAGGSISAAQYQYGKVTICHHTHSKKHPTVTITINQHAWPAHQRHGDTMGACAATSSSKHHGHGQGHGSKGSDEDAGSTTTSTATTTATPPTHGHGGGNGGSNHGHK
jgi:hypothetical protein